MAHALAQMHSCTATSVRALPPTRPQAKSTLCITSEPPSSPPWYRRTKNVAVCTCVAQKQRGSERVHVLPSRRPLGAAQRGWEPGGRGITWQTKPAI